MRPIRITHRETEDYAMEQPILLKIHIKSGVALVDRLHEYNPRIKTVPRKVGA